MKRVTIAEVARAAGVSKSAVSYAANGQPGVSEQTRERIMAVANDLGWRPNRAARAMRGLRAGAVGVVLSRPPELLGDESFYVLLMSGIQDVLARRDMSMLLRMTSDTTEEIGALVHWAQSRSVDGVILNDLVRGDERIGLVQKLGLPAVLTGDPLVSAGLPSIWRDEMFPAHQLVRFLAELGHRQIGRVQGIPELCHIQTREQVFNEAALQRGLPPPVCISTDFSREQGIRATREILSLAERPTAIVYDNDAMAVSGLSVAASMGLSVPGDVSLIAWDDSFLCQISSPQLTALTSDVAEFGRELARGLIAVVRGEDFTSHPTRPSQLQVRGSTGPAPTR